MARELACRKCKTITSGKVCPNCHSTDLSSNWGGIAVIFDTEKSYVAKVLNISKPGRYALMVP